MPKIELETLIKTDNIEVVFDLIRSIDLHKISTKNSNEQAIAGKTSGLISLGETVTWRAKHLGVTQELTSIITDYQSPTFFADEMVKGAFKSFRHEHYLKIVDSNVIVKDVFEYKSPFGFLGKLADFLFLKKYMTNFLIERNEVIKEFAETEKWKSVLKE
ncbi:SRPBCC family protein [Tenacibaculum aquimarinum]|uniref:SRPBCC family protein n=1 Tax=Tenacibaculum aquimarinum TaxID=2910675 RepID=UPI001F0B1D7C|nr:SRPBCC family protein [Tenacibaculum aquimarinum]MCH3885411.1 SRPBCC family protein [Tenacibaculum aquimarinum]